MTRRPPTTRLRLTNLEDRLTPAGGLDTAFGTGGLARTGVVSAAEWNPGQQVAALPGGGMLVAGEDKDLRVRLARLNADGTPDATFGTAGVVSLGSEYVGLAGLAAGPGGTVYVLSSTVATPTLTSYTQVVRLTPSGALDASFGVGGVAVTGSMSWLTMPGSVGVRPDGGVVVGSGFSGAVSEFSAAGTQMLPAGTGVPDPDGLLTRDVRGIYATADGGLILVREGFRWGEPKILAVVTRLTATGALDTAYGTDGRVGIDIPQGDFAEGFLALGLDPAGGLLLARTGTQSYRVGPVKSTIVRVTPAGQLDSAFAGDGAAEVDAPGGRAVTGGGVLADGRVVLTAENPSGAGLLARVLAADGTADAGFADGGWLIATGGSLADYRSINAHSFSTAIVLADGRVAVLGATGPAGAPELAVAVLSLTAETPAGGVYVAPVVVTPPEPPVFVTPPEGSDPRSETVLIAPPGGSIPDMLPGDTTVTVTVVNPVLLSQPGLSNEELAATTGVAPPVANPTTLVEGPFTVLPQPVRVDNDFNGDGFADKVVTSGPQVSVVSGSDGTVLLKAFAPFEASYTGTLNAVFVDVDGNGQDELVVSPGMGGGPVVAVYNADGTERGRFWGIEDANFRGGVNLAVSQFFSSAAGVGVSGLIVAAGAGGGPRVAVFDTSSLGAGARRLMADFFAFEPGLRTGVVVADGLGTLVFGAGAGGGPRVRGLYTRNLFQASAAGSLDGIPPGDQPFDRFVGDSASRQGVTLAVRPVTPLPRSNSYYTQEVVATVGTAPPEVVLEFGLFVVN